MTPRRHNQKADADGRTPRADAPLRRSVLGRMMWSRVLPGSVAVVAALTVPEFSVGAGDLAGGERFDDPPDPVAERGQAGGKLVTGAVKGPLAGVRYGALIAVNAATPLPAPPSQIANLKPAAPRRIAPAVTGTLDEAAEYAASVLTGFTAPPGLRADTSLAIGAPAVDPARDTLDTVAVYTAAVIEKFVEQPERRPALAVAAPGGAAPLLSASDLVPPPPSAPQLALSAPLAIPSTTAQADVAPQVAPAGLGEPLAVAAGPPLALAVQPAAAVPEPVGLAPPAAKPAPTAPTALASAAPSAAVRVIAAAQPVPVAKPAAANPAPPVAALVAAVPKPAPPLTEPAFNAPAASPYRLDITSQLTTRVDGKSAGAVDFAQTESGLKVRLGSLVELLGERYDPAQIARIKASSASQVYLSLAELQSQGIPISYDPVYDEFNVGLTDTRPTAARKVHIDQITAPERGADSTGIDQVRP